MPNTSASGGPLDPDSSPPYGDDLNKIIQNWLVPLIGLAGNLVVVYDQPEPPQIPDAGIAWAAVRVHVGTGDKFAFVGNITVAGQPAYQLQRHEPVDLLCSFYDLGSTGLAQSYMARCRDALSIRQNLDPLYAAAMALEAVGDAVALPSLLKQRWLYRVDLPIAVRRQVTRVYPVSTLLTAGIELDANVEAGSQLIVRTIPVPPA